MNAIIFVVGVLTAFLFQTRASVGSSSYLLPMPRGCLQEGGTLTAVGLGREIKHLNSAPQPDAMVQDRSQTLNSGWMHPWAKQLLDCVGSLNRYRGPEARWAWHRVVPATQKAEQLDRDKTHFISLKWKTFSVQGFCLLSLYKMTAQCKGYGDFLSLNKIKNATHLNPKIPPFTSFR